MAAIRAVDSRSTAVTDFVMKHLGRDLSKSDRRSFGSQWSLEFCPDKPVWLRVAFVQLFELSNGASQELRFVGDRLIYATCGTQRVSLIYVAWRPSLSRTTPKIEHYNLSDKFSRAAVRFFIYFWKGDFGNDLWRNLVPNKTVSSGGDANTRGMVQRRIRLGEKHILDVHVMFSCQLRNKYKNLRGLEPD